LEFLSRWDIDPAVRKRLPPFFDKGIKDRRTATIKSAAEG
jgi:hypothetical protein